MSRTTYLFLIHCVAIILFTSCKENTVDFIQLGSISGLVYESDSGDALEGVEITTVPATSVVFTDSTGAFRIENVPAESYRLRARLENYQVESVSITVAGTSEATSTIFLIAETGLLNSATNPIPADNAADVSSEMQLNWENPNDTVVNVTYDVEIFEANADEIFQTIVDLEDTFTTVDNLKFSTQYFWQVITKNSLGEIEFSQTWKFTTGSTPINPILLTIPNEDGDNEIYSASEEGELTRLTYESGNKFGPLYNPDGSSIAFIGISGLEHHIYVMNREGRELDRITTLPVASYHQQGRGFSWSPDGAKILYCHYDKLYSIDVDGTNLQEIATAPTDRHFRSCNWGESTNQIIAETIGTSIYDGEIFLMDDDGSNMTELVANGPGIIENPSFTIDGLSFIYTSDLSGNEALRRQLNAHILLAPIASPASTTDLSSSKEAGTNDLFPRVSSNGASVIFLNRNNNASGVGSIITVPVDDPSLRTELVVGGEYPSWR